MLDHPSNPNSPTYWHARGYGLFSANVFGRKVFDPKQEELTLTLEPGKSVTFRHRVLILGTPGDAGIDRARVQDVRGGNVVFEMIFPGAHEHPHDDHDDTMFTMTNTQGFIVAIVPSCPSRDWPSARVRRDRGAQLVSGLL